MNNSSEKLYKAKCRYHSGGKCEVAQDCHPAKKGKGSLSRIRRYFSKQLIKKELQELYKIERTMMNDSKAVIDLCKHK